MDIQVDEKARWSLHGRPDRDLSLDRAIRSRLVQSERYLSSVVANVGLEQPQAIEGHIQEGSTADCHEYRKAKVLNYY